MTRDSIPRDDLYGELEVSRQASVAAIEAAYRRLVKQHHPDVARSDDLERIKRLNLAREWLTDLDRRRRYDLSQGMSPTSAFSHHAPGTSTDGSFDGRGRPTPRAARAAPEDAAEPSRTFGVNANEVRIFLAGLRGLDSDRARRVFDGRAVAHAKGYSGARRTAAEIGQAKRKTEWQLAREAASVIARGKLGDTILTERVVDVLADAAGAIAIRDLLTKADYNLVLLPWTWTSARVDPASATSTPTATKPAPAPAAAATATTPSPTGTVTRPADQPVVSPVTAQATPHSPSVDAPPAMRAVRAPTASIPWPAADLAAPRPPIGAAPVTAQAPAGLPAPAPLTPATTAASPPPPIIRADPPVAKTATRPSLAPLEEVLARPVSEPVRPAAAPAASAAISARAVPAGQSGATQPRPSTPSTNRPTLAPGPPVEKRPSLHTLTVGPPPAEVVAAQPVTTTAAPGAAVFAMTASRRRPPYLPAAAALIVVIGIAGVMAGIVPPREQEVAAITDAPTGTNGEPTGFVVAPGSIDPATDPTATDGVVTPGQEPTERPANVDDPTPVPPPPDPDPTAKPPKPTHRPDNSTPPPGPTPSPTPVPPTPTPEPVCTVPNFVNTQPQKADQKWANSGFTGSVIFDGAFPPGSKIQWQSVPAGTSLVCSSDITVSDQVPPS